MDNIKIGLRITSAREEKGLTKKELAIAIGVAPSTIQRYESGEIAKIKLPVIESIANVLDVNPMWIVGKSDNKVINKYYTDEETLRIAQQLKDNKELCLLFDAAKDSSPDDLRLVHDMLLRMKKAERGE